MFQPKFDAEKFRGLILYAADQARAKRDQYFGAVKLNKILFYSDFIMFQRYGVPVLSELRAQGQFDARSKVPLTSICIRAFRIYCF